MNIIESASKLVFIAMALAAIVLTIIGKLDPKDFMILASGTFAFYYSNKGDTSKEFLGK